MRIADTAIVKTFFFGGGGGGSWRVWGGGGNPLHPPIDETLNVHGLHWIELVGQDLAIYLWPNDNQSETYSIQSCTQ